MFEDINLPPEGRRGQASGWRGPRYFETERVDEDPVPLDLAPGAGPFGGGAS